MRGDINAVELYQDREFLTRVGYGIYDVAFGSSGGVGFEDVHRFSYLEAKEDDPKMYRRKVYDLVGNYYPNDLAHQLWVRFQQYQEVLSHQKGSEVDLKEAALAWLDCNGHDFFKMWTLHKEEVPFRMRNGLEPHLDYLDIMTRLIAPQWRELTEAGFHFRHIVSAALHERREGQGPRGSHYLRVVARLSGHPIQDQAEADKRQAEIERLQNYLEQQLGRSVGRREATVEYYRRLNLIADIESQPQVSAQFAGAMA